MTAFSGSRSFQEIEQMHGKSLAPACIVESLTHGNTIHPYKRRIMADQRTNEELDQIWKCVREGKYRDAIKELAKSLPGPIIVPEHLFSDGGGDCMSIPHIDGTHREIYRRKSVTKKWEVI
jgi:hypothetical protein